MVSSSACPRPLIISLTGILLSFLAVLAPAQEDAKQNFSEQQLEFFETKVRPLLVDKCFECHGPDAEDFEGGLSLSSRTDIMTGGDSGASIVPGDPDESLLIQAIRYDDVYEMPPSGKMSDDEIDVLTEWVKMGAPWPAESDKAVASKEAFDIAARKAAHWCWQPIVKPNVPSVKQSDWPNDPVDNFILAKLESKGISPAAPASRRALIRRLYFDIIGLPPTPQQVDAFLADSSDNSIEKVVDQLLASPHYGERWARHWMDLMRYAETYGHEFDYPIPQAHEYRDYLIRAINADVSHDDFIREHIAGDLIDKPRRHPEEDFDESIIGTGFWFLHEAKHAPTDVRLEEAGYNDNRIDVMTKSFLALTVSCARCHDHKFDAISTKDYYALVGFLQSSREQNVMLDPGRKIEMAHDKLTKLSGEINSQLGPISEMLNFDSDKSKLTEYLASAIQVLRHDPEWNRTDGFTIQGEAMKSEKVASGVVEKQQLSGKELQWEGDTQIWWRDGTLDDAWELSFSLNKNQVPGESAKFEVFANLTQASDYGAFNISLNGKVLKNNFDAYSPQLAMTGPMSIGTISLKPGKQKLTFRITGHHESAVPRHMIGLDYLRLVPQSSIENSSAFTMDALTKDDPLMAEHLPKLVAALKSPKLASLNHPLHWLQLATKTNQPLDQKFANRIAQELNQRIKTNQQANEKTKLIADFSDGIPEDWFTTGFAFNYPHQTNRFNASSPEDFIASPGTVTSGALGKQLFGVLRSPTFTLEHPNLFYHMKGNATVRLIIEGYSMDSYNALLFRGCKFDFKSPDEFRWHRQSGDIKNFIGHRCHIEIIDHGNSSISIDEIRMGPDAHPAAAANSVLASLSKWKPNDDSDANVTSFAKHASQGLLAELNAESIDASALASWIVHHSLVPICSGKLKVPDNGSISLKETVAQTLKEFDKVAQEIPAPRFALGISEGTPENEFVFIRGNSKNLGEVAHRRFLEAFDSKDISDSEGSGRMVLANQIASADNPLTSRVAVNRVWHHLFGRGIVPSVDNFGVLGQTPTHPELLDYLAREYSADGWSTKRLIRRLVLTKTYQMATKTNTESVEKVAIDDPDNTLLYKARIKRIQGEAMRDAMLQISGRLDKKMYGPPVAVHLTPFMQGRGRPRSGPLDGDGRRSIYVSVRRNFLPPMMLAFDTPQPFNAIGRRNKSNVPAQALILMNDPFVIQQSEKWAERLIKEDQSVADRITTIYKEAFSREPTQIELQKFESFVQQQAAELDVKDENKIKNDVRIWRDICHVIFNVKEFIYLD